MKLVNGIFNFFETSGKLRMMAYLKSRSDSQLLEWGFSPRMLQDEGLSAWPWRLDQKPAALSIVKKAMAEEKRSIKELQSCSDAELADLNLSRSAIKDAVRNGRPGMDHTDTPQAA